METMAPPPGGGLLITIPSPIPPQPPPTVVAKSSEQERSVMGKKIESIDETPEITEEGEASAKANANGTKLEEKEARPTLGNGAKKNLKHFTFAKEDMEFKPPKKPCTKGGESQIISLFYLCF